MASLTKEDLIKAHEQGLNVQTKGGTNFKVLAHLMDVFAVQYSNSTKISWYGIDKINELQCSIESKIEIDFSILKVSEIYVFKTKLHTYIAKYRKEKKEYIELDSNYLLKNNLKEPFIRGLETCVITEINTPTESELELFYSKFPELKPKKYNGRAVKCDSVEQWKWIINKIANKEPENNILFNEGNNCITILDNVKRIGLVESDLYFIKKNYEIISFSQYCAEQGIKEPQWIQGFEVKDGYNDVVMVSVDKKQWHCHLLTSVNVHSYPFHCKSGGSWSYARYPRKGEINEIKFID